MADGIKSRGQRSIFWWDDQNGVSIIGPPHENLGVVRIRFDQGIARDGLVPGQDLRLLLCSGLYQTGPLAQWLVRVNVDAQLHPPANGPQHQRLTSRLVDRHQPGGEALVATDAREEGQVAVTDWHAPCHAGVKVVIHAHGELGVPPGGTNNSASLCSVAVPGVVHTI